MSKNASLISNLILSAAVLHAVTDARSASTALLREVICAKENVRFSKACIHSWIQANTSPKSALVGSPRYVLSYDWAGPVRKCRAHIIAFWLAGPGFGWVACTHVGRRTATLSSYVYHEIPFPIWGKDIDEPGAAVRARVRSGSAHGDFGCGGAVPRIRVSETHLLCVVPHLHL